MENKTTQSTQTVHSGPIESRLCENCSKILCEDGSVDGSVDSSVDGTVDEDKSLFQKLDEIDIEELEHTCEMYVLEYIEHNLVSFSKGNFDSEIVDNVSHIIYQTFNDGGLFKEDDFDELYEYVNSICLHTLRSVEIPAYYEEHIQSYETKSVSAEDIQRLHTSSFRVPQSVAAKSPHLSQFTDVKQRTNEWYELRHNILTASNIWKAFSTESQRNSLIYEKCSPFVPRATENISVNTSSPLHWGVKYEPLTTMMYEKENSTGIDEFGCIQHPTYDFLGASPDGINTKAGNLYGRMVEIKNIVNREISGRPSEAYWIQMQLQMECCNIDVCDFVETRFKEYETEEEFYGECDTTRQRGVILHYIDKNLVNSGVPHYEYMPLETAITVECITNWVSSKSLELKGNFVLYEKKYWYLDQYMCVSVRRNRMWFQEAIEKMDDVWKTIEKERLEGYQHRAPKKRIKQNTTSAPVVIKLDTEPVCNIVLDEVI